MLVLSCVILRPTHINPVTRTSSRFWLEPLEPIWQYRGKYYLGKTADVEDKDQVSKCFRPFGLCPLTYSPFVLHVVSKRAYAFSG